jgi:hypothetical protein
MMRGTKTGHFVNSARRGLTLYWLAQMSKDIQDQWGASKLTDADVMGLADGGSNHPDLLLISRPGRIPFVGRYRNNDFIAGKYPDSGRSGGPGTLRRSLQDPDDRPPLRRDRPPSTGPASASRRRGRAWVVRHHGSNGRPTAGRHRAITTSSAPASRRRQAARRRSTRQRRAAIRAGDHLNRQRLLGQPRYAGRYQAIFQRRHQYRPDTSTRADIFRL